MSFVEFSSEVIGDGLTYYSVSKWRIRKQWMLVKHGTRVTEIAAYFRTEDEARQFAATFNLRVRDWSAQLDVS